MTKFDDDDTDLDLEEDEHEGIKNLRAQAKKAAQWQKKAEALEREVLGMKSGLKPSKMTDLFLKTYEGELTVDAVRAAAAELGLIAEEQGESDGSNQNSEERAAHERISKASAGAKGDDTWDYEAAIKNAKTQDEVLAAYRRKGGQVSGIDYEV